MASVVIITYLCNINKGLWGALLRYPLTVFILYIKNNTPMIFTFRIVSDEVDNFRREIKIDADATFLDLKNAICDSVDYDKNQMCSFFICDNGWEKEKEITLEDMGSDSAQEVYLMDDSVLSDFIDDEGQRLIFTFDYMTDRSFFLEMKHLETGRNLIDPVCSMAIGKAPSQMMEIEEFETKNDAKAKIAAAAAAAAAVAAEDMDEEFYGSNQYNVDEFSADGFDEMSFDDKY